jgi:hypothetical protein
MGRLSAAFPVGVSKSIVADGCRIPVPGLGVEFVIDLAVEQADNDRTSTSEKAAKMDKIGFLFPKIHPPIITRNMKHFVLGMRPAGSVPEMEDRIRYDL